MNKVLCGDKTLTIRIKRTHKMRRGSRWLSKYLRVYNFRFQLDIVLASVLTVSASAVANRSDFSQFKGKAYEVVKNAPSAKGWELLPKQEDEIFFCK